MNQNYFYRLRRIVVCVAAVLFGAGTYAQEWDIPELQGSDPETETTYYIYNVGMNGFLNRGGNWGTEAIVTTHSQVNVSNDIVKWKARSVGSTWTFQYNAKGLDAVNHFLFAANTASGDVYTDNSGNSTWNIFIIDAVAKTYSIQVTATYGGYNASQFLGASSVVSSTNRGLANRVLYNFTGGNNYTHWKFVTQASYELYQAKVVLNSYMNYAKLKGGIDLTTYIATYNAGITADINTASDQLLTALGRTAINIPNHSFETNGLANWTNTGGFVTKETNPMIGWTKDGNVFSEKFTNHGSVLGSGALTQTISGLANGMYSLLVSAQAYQQAGSNPYFTGAFITAGNQSTEISAGKDYSIENIIVANGSLTIGYKLEAPVACNWTAFDNFRLYYYGPLATPVITPSKTTLPGFDEYNTSQTFTVTGVSLQDDILITAPTGFSVSPATIAKESATDVLVTVTYDGSTHNATGNISLNSTGAAQKNLAVTGRLNSVCYSPVFSDRPNLIHDPYMNSLTDFESYYGTIVVNTDPAFSYCGANSGKVITSGSIQEEFVAKPYTRYRVKAKVYCIGGSFQVGSYNLGVPEVKKVVSTTGSWQDVDFSFTTGNTTSAGVYFNNYQLNGTTGYIDNWELYEDDLNVTENQIIDADLSVFNLRVSPGKNLTINTGKTLNVSGNITLESNASGTATLINNGTLNVTGTSTVQQYLTSKSGETNTDNWWYIASPVTGANSGSILQSESGNLLGYYDEPSADYPQITATNVALTTGKGYLAKINTTGTYNFVGALNNGDKTVVLSRTGTENAKRGFNLIGNPYPSFLDWNAAHNGRTDIRSAIWYRTRTADGAMTFDTYNGETGTSNGINGVVGQYIPPMQAFWVKVSADNTTPEITFSNAMRSSKDQSSRANRLRTKAAVSYPLIRLEVSNGTNRDQTIVYSGTEAQNTYDKSDAEKISSNDVLIPEIYSLVENRKLVINKMHSFVHGLSIPLGFNPGQAGDFSISASELSNIDSDLRIMLHDSFSNRVVELNEGLSYNFSSTAESAENRFSLRFESRGATTGISAQEADIRISQNTNRTIRISGLLSTNEIIQIYSADGRLQYTQKANSAPLITDKSFAPGIYLVKAGNSTFKINIY